MANTTAEPWVDVSLGGQIGVTLSLWVFGLIAFGLSAFHFLHPNGITALVYILAVTGFLAFIGGAFLWWSFAHLRRWVRAVPEGLLVADHAGTRLIHDREIEKAAVARLPFHGVGTLAIVWGVLTGFITGRPIGLAPGWITTGGGIYIVAADGTRSELTFAYTTGPGVADPLATLWSRLSDRVTINVLPPQTAGS